VSDQHEARRKRIERVRARMSELGVDALLLSHGADLPWLTGYRAQPLERLTLLVLPREGEPVLLVPALEAPLVPDSGGMITLRPWAESEDPVALAGALLAPERDATYAISDRAWAHSVLALQERLPDAHWKTASTVTSPLRAVKDDREIAALQAAAQAADSVAAALQRGEIPLAGRRENQVSEALSMGLLAAGHRRVNFAIVGSGPNGASPHHDPGERVIEVGDTVVCDFGGEFVLDDDVAYCSDITRTVAVGEPGDEVRETYAVLLAAQRAAVDAVAPGVTAEHVDAVARAVITDAGLGRFFIHRTGHGIGIEEHEDPYVVAGNDTPLEVGHAFSVEPGIYFPGRFGMRLEDIVVVGTGGVIPLNTADHSLVVLG
jgi:Xaa-Pro aminopeptidase